MKGKDPRLPTKEERFKHRFGKRERAMLQEDPRFELTGGWVIFQRTGERRFIPIGLKRVLHCKSCGYFRKAGLCQLDGSYTNPDATCEHNTNRNQMERVKVNYP